MIEQQKIEGLLADTLAEIEETHARLAELEAEVEGYREQLKPSA